ncbi:hypothetical protein CRUP_032040 [Coryphaenoides rupestris]|nr:hypothetical protein CRUP_032040 [Coryphaenoides rupestris]
MENTEEPSPLRITPTVRALSSALRGKRPGVAHGGGGGGGGRGRRGDGEPAAAAADKLWFKESSAKNLRSRDFLSPTTMLHTLYGGGQVPPTVLSRVLSLRGGGVLPLAGGEVMGEGLRVRVDRAASFGAVLAGGASEYMKPSVQRQGRVVINCPALHPKPNALPSPGTLTLGQLRTVLVADHTGALLRRQGFTVSYCPVLPEGSDITAFLHTLGVDWPTVPAGWSSTEEKVQEALAASPYREEEDPSQRSSGGGGGGGGGRGSQTEQQEGGGEKDGALRVNLKRYRGTVCPTWHSWITPQQTARLRRGQMKDASEMKYGDQGQTWDDIIRVMTSATIRFELLSTVHTSPVTLDVQKEGGVSTKGPRGLYPEIPEVSQLDFSALKEEGEWLLLFNYLIPFSELLDQSGQSLDCEGGGARVCKFLVSLSKDFSSYYNRVHVLGEPLPHLFNQMFCRLRMLRALTDLYHSALETLHLPPIRQL